MARATYHLRRNAETDRWRWRLVDEQGLVLAVSGREFPTKGEANIAIELVRRALIEADAVTDTTVPGTRWRRINEDGTMGELVGDDPPDNDDEGETGPPEVDLDRPGDAA